MRPHRLSLALLTVLTLALGAVRAPTSRAQVGGLCPGAPLPRLAVGGQARVTPGSGNRVRALPSTASEARTVIPGEGVFDVLEGPTCGEGYTWWRVRYRGVEGWTVEGSGAAYFIEPWGIAVTPTAPPRPTPIPTRDGVQAPLPTLPGFGLALPAAPALITGARLARADDAGRTFALLGWPVVPLNTDVPPPPPTVTLRPSALFAEDVARVQALLALADGDDFAGVASLLGTPDAQPALVTLFGGRAVRHVTQGAAGTAYVLDGLSDDGQVLLSARWPLVTRADGALMPNLAALDAFAAAIVLDAAAFAAPVPDGAARPLPPPVRGPAPCGAAAAPPRLIVGGRARVIVAVPLAAAPGSAPGTVTLAAGGDVGVLDGPACTPDGALAWQVARDGGTPGWVVENSGGVYQLAPAEGVAALPPAPTVPLAPTPDATLAAAGAVPVQRNSAWAPVTRAFDDGVLAALVPPGCFMLGDDAAPGSAPAQAQCLTTPFWIDVSEVRVGTWARLGGQAALSQPAGAASAEHPRVNVTWAEAAAFCALRGAALPTEDVWEYAARGPESWRYPWGPTALPDGLLYTSPTTPFVLPTGSIVQDRSWVGALDMMGNAAEWTASLSRPYPYRADDGREDALADGPRVLRGPLPLPLDPAAALPLRVLPLALRADADAALASPLLGFRCARLAG